jgi:hypothetical protein
MTFKERLEINNRPIDLENLSKTIDEFIKYCFNQSDQFKFSLKKMEELLQKYSPDSDEYLFLSALAETLYFIEYFLYIGSKTIESVREQAEWQRKIVKLFIRNSDPALARRFWSIFDQILESYKKRFSSQIIAENQKDLSRVMAGIRQGLIGEIGFYRALRKLGLEAEISDLEDDVNAGVDVIVKTSSPERFVKTLIQVKCSQRGREIKIYDANNPQTSLNLGNEVDSNLRQAIQILGGVCYVKKAHEPNTNFRGLVVVVPVDYFDENTAEPKKEKMSFVQQALEKYFPELRKD